MPRRCINHPQQKGDDDGGGCMSMMLFALTPGDRKFLFRILSAYSSPPTSSERRPSKADAPSDALKLVLDDANLPPASVKKGPVLKKGASGAHCRSSTLTSGRRRMSRIAVILLHVAGAEGGFALIRYRTMRLTTDDCSITSTTDARHSSRQVHAAIPAARHRIADNCARRDGKGHRQHRPAAQRAGVQADGAAAHHQHPPGVFARIHEPSTRGSFVGTIGQDAASGERSAEEVRLPPRDCRSRRRVVRRVRSSCEQDSV